ncbi:TetR/AcrR family transcriptional regulator [Streptomyces sp. NPDC001941]|uniref:TetR/AcrR family transcriptional regulator n=1 Tax=Streptomyces sp. NPDC001941 TaxID=3154659 RepID=UPI00332D3069
MKLTADGIIDAGMAVFAESGYRGLTMRQVADRLGAHAGSLYYHVPSKTALPQLMADRLAREAYDAATAALDALPEEPDWKLQLEIQAVALRQVIRQRPGGAVLFADSPKVLSAGALSVTERLLRTLAAAGVAREERAVAADTLLSHVTGFVLQEQSEPPAVHVTAQAAADVHARFPLTVESAAAHTPDERFVRGVRLLCAGIEASSA